MAYVQLSQVQRPAEMRAASYRDEDRSVEVIWTTGATVRRQRSTGWDSYAEFDEELVVTNGAVRLGRLNSGAPLLDSHSTWSLRSQIGKVMPGTAEIRGGKGYARVQLSVNPQNEGIIADIRAGIISNISVGYRIHKIEKKKHGDGEPELWRVVDWEPMELSAVPIPADAGAHVRSLNRDGLEIFPAEIVEAALDLASAARARMRMRAQACGVLGS